MRGRRILIPLPNTGALARRRHVLCIRVAIVIFIIIFVIVQLNVINYDFHDNSPSLSEASVNDSALAILQMVPPVFHKFLKPKNGSQGLCVWWVDTFAFLMLNFWWFFLGSNASAASSANEKSYLLNISEIKRNIEKYNDYQSIINEDIYGPLQNDSVIIVVQVSWPYVPFLWNYLPYEHYLFGG